MASIKIHRNGVVTETNAEVGTLISDILDLSGHKIDYPCAKKGICKKCLVKAFGELSEPTQSEIETFDEDINNGFRLACLSKIMGDCEIFTEKEADIQAGKLATEIKSTNPMHKEYGLAVDIGTTTLAISLYKESKRLKTITEKNPQVNFGADVISRIEEQMDGKTEEISKAVIQGINSIIEKLCNSQNISSDLIDACVITGNTTMLHLLMKEDCTPLSKFPFNAKYLGGNNVKAKELAININENANIFLPYCFSAFVGADITTAVIASDMCNKKETALLIDIGTNGEMALWHDGKLSCCSTAAGPAFEGVGIKCGMHGVAGAIDHAEYTDGEIKYTTIKNQDAVGICGSGVIDCISTMLSCGILDETGMIDDLNEEFEDRLVEDDEDIMFEFGNGIGIYGKDVRAVQLAKSAICAGTQTLMHANNITNEDIDIVYIAGGFGSFIDISHAGKIGLIPNEITDKVQVLGNAALLGAEMLLLNKDLTEEAKKLTSDFELTELATNPFFMDSYVENMCFEVDEICV